MFFWRLGEVFESISIEITLEDSGQYKKRQIQYSHISTVQPQEEMTDRGPHESLEVCESRVPVGWSHALFSDAKK